MPVATLYRRFDGYEELKPILEGSDEEVLLALEGLPALIRIPGTAAGPRARFVSCLLHGNEDSGFRAVLALLRRAEHFPFDLWVLIGNTRAASRDGWFAHRYLDDQEDFNRVWGLPGDTAMRRCAAALLGELSAAGLEAAVDLHNNTGENPPYAIVPVWTPQALHLAAVCAATVLHWPLRAHTLMEALAPLCPSVAVECGRPGLAQHAAFAEGALDRFLAEKRFDAPSRAPRVGFALRYRVVVRPDVVFAFGGVLGGDVRFVLTPGLDGANFGMLLAGTELGRVQPGTPMPLLATDLDGADVTWRFFDVTGDGRVVVTSDVTPAMMTTTVVQARRDCLFYVARRLR